MLLIHGTGDGIHIFYSFFLLTLSSTYKKIIVIIDNVHFQNSAVLAKVLRSTKLDLEFEVFTIILM